MLKLALDWGLYDDWLRRGKSQQADFLESVGRIGMAHDKDKDSKWLVCDPLAVAAAIAPELVTGHRVSFNTEDQ